MASKPARPEAETKQALRETESSKPRVTPSKALMLSVVISYTISNALFLVTILLNLPILKDTINLGNGTLGAVFQVLEDYYLALSIPASVIVLVGTMIIYSSYVRYGFPSLLSFVAILYNDVVSMAFMVLIYILDIRNIYFSFQIVYIIPIITIFLSSVFIIDDFDDYRKGLFSFPEDDPEKRRAKKGKPQKGALQQTELPDERDEDAQNFLAPTFESIKAISSAAKLAIPNLSKKKSNEVNENAAQSSKEQHQE